MTALPRQPRRRPLRDPAGRPAILAFLLALCLVAGLVACPPALAGVDDTIDRILSEREIARSAAGIYVWDLDAGRAVYAHNGDTRFTPASNMKLITAAAALIEWDAEHRFTTELYASGDRVVNGVLPGNLYLRGYGDPSLSTAAFQRRELGFSTATVEAFVRSVRARGITTVAGRVVGDEGWFDDERAVDSWKPGIDAWCGPLSALSANQGRHGKKRVAEPASYAAALLTTALRKAGVKVSRGATTGSLPASAILLQEQRSAELGVLLAHMNKQSDNHFAETLLKGLGKDTRDLGSTESGAAQSKQTLATIGIPPSDAVIADGSGLSYANRLTAHDIARVLGAMWQRQDFGSYYNSLSIAGKDGTLHDRMRGTAAQGNARAKTGTLNVATSLSGYVRSADNHLVAFSILITGNPVDWERGNAAQDAIVAALAEAQLGGRRALRVGPETRQCLVLADEAVHTVGRALKPVVEP